MTTDDPERIVRIDLPIASEEELADLRGALLAARAGELSQARRRGTRHALGYGSDSARATMSDEVEQAERRWTMLDRLLAAIERATTPDAE